MKNKLKVLDLFAGIGGFTLGLEKTSLYETVAFCEWDKSCQEDLQQVYSDPFGRKNNRWPQPLLCRMDVPLPRRVDRLKQVGNSVYWPIVEQLGYHLHSNISDI